MRLSKLMILLALLGTLMLGACSPGGGNAGAPTKLQIKVFEGTTPTPKTLLVEDAATVQKMYTSMSALPEATTICQTIWRGSPYYELTFWEGEQIIATAAVDPGGCGFVRLGADDVRQPDEAFWQLLDQTLASAPAALAQEREIV